MLSIFIWKTTSSASTAKKIKICTGSNWFLQETPDSQNSYKYIAQEVIEVDSKQIMVQHVKEMPNDWVGSDVLEMIELPYEEIKNDEYGSLIKIGSWFRLTLKKMINFEKRTLESEFQMAIGNWKL
jgi:hypothetical protein